MVDKEPQTVYFFTKGTLNEYRIFHTCDHEVEQCAFSILVVHLTLLFVYDYFMIFCCLITMQKFEGIFYIFFHHLIVVDLLISYHCQFFKEWWEPYHNTSLVFWLAENLRSRRVSFSNTNFPEKFHKPETFHKFQKC